MSEESKGSGAPASGGGAESGASPNDKKVVAYDDHERALKDLQKFKAQAKEAADKASKLEQEKMLAEGKKDDLIGTLNKQITELKMSTADMQKRFASEKVNAWLKTKAAGSGAIDGGAADKFVSLVDFKGRNPFRDDSSFALDETVLAQVFEDSKKELPYFFSKAGPTVRDVNPNANPGSAQSGKDLSQMSLDEIRAKARDMSNSQ